jgi:hypothetical protein
VTLPNSSDFIIGWRFCEFSCISGPGFCCPSQAEARECTFTGLRDSGEIEVWVSDDLLLNHGVGKNDTTISGVVCV